MSRYLPLGVFLFLLFSGMTCGTKWVKYAAEQELELTPSSIPLQSGNISFHLRISVPAKHLKKFDSLVYELVTDGSQSIAKVTIDEKTALNDEGKLEQKAQIHRSFKLTGDKTDVLVAFKAYKNGRFSSSPGLSVGEIKQE